jgi:hypothetical protein
MAFPDIAPSTDAQLADSAAASPRSRRALLAAALGSVAGSLATAIARPVPTDAAAGDKLTLGTINYAGSSATRLNATSSGGAFWMTQNGSGSGVRSDSTAGHGGVFTTAHADRDGLLVQDLATTTGGGAALHADGGNNTGVAATSNAGPKNAVDAHHTANGTALYGQSDGGDGVFGESTSHFGVEGTSASGIGVRGLSANVGMYGESSGSGYGVYGSCNAGGGVRAASMTGTGALCTSTSATGVWGQSDSGYGIYGTSNSSYAGYFSGSCYAASFTSTASPVVRIDHPLAPATRVLAHATVISDQQATLYSGTVRTDAHGEATVSLPSWFEAFNADVRYQLTPFADVRTWVKSKISQGSFSIATSEPGIEVCWQLTGARRDATASAHPLAVDTRKSGPEAGHYLSPLEHRQPASKAVDHELRKRFEPEAGG